MYNRPQLIRVIMPIDQSLEFQSISQSSKQIENFVNNNINMYLKHGFVEYGVIIRLSVINQYKLVLLLFRTYNILEKTV